MTPPFLLSLVTNIWFRRACVVGVIVIALLVARQHYINVGKTQGTAKQVETTAATSEQQRVQSRTQAVEQIDSHQAQIDALASAIAQQQKLILTLAVQRQAVPAQMQGMTAEQVQQFINTAIGKKDSGQPYTLGEQQQIAGCFKDRDLCNRQVDEQQGAITKLGQQVTEQNQQYAALVDYTATVERVYVQLRNDTAQPKRSPKCLWLWKCVHPKITLPDPADLKKPTALVQAAKEQP